MMNWSNRKTQKKIAAVIVIIIVLAMVIGTIVPAVSALG